MDLTLSTAQPHACHYEAEEKNIRTLNYTYIYNIHTYDTYIHVHVLIDRQRHHLQLKLQSKSCNLSCVHVYEYFSKACVHTHLLGDVETLSRINLCVEKVNCIRERQTTLHLDLYGRRHLARYIRTPQPMQHTVPCAVEW